MGPLNRLDQDDSPAHPDDAATRGPSEEALARHSFDLVHFPMYLAQMVPTRVRVEVTQDKRPESDLMVFYEDKHVTRSRKFATLVADDEGCLTGSDAFYHLVHEACRARRDDSTYIGFTRYGRPVYAPLFALSLLYRRFGRGIHLDGDVLPTPWAELSVDYAFGLR
jgi:hypothetical protein